MTEPVHNNAFPNAAPIADRSIRRDPFEAAQRQRILLVRIVRIGFVILFLTVTLLAILGVQTDDRGLQLQAAILWPITLFIATGVIALALAIDYLTPRKKVSTLFSVFIGLLAAFLATIAVGFIIQLAFISRYLRLLAPSDTT